MQELSRNIKRIAMVPALGFALLCVYLSYWQFWRAPELRANPHNSRAQERLRSIEPGKLYDTDMQVLLGAQRRADGWKRTYPAGSYACHLTGYNERSGLQRRLRDAFLSAGEYESPWAEFVDGPLRGNDVILTVDLDAQELATRLLRGRRGAVVALSAHSGAVLALVSAPAYDPELILTSEGEFQIFQADPNVPELNRALQGLYPPGSVIKVFTAAVVLDLDRAREDTTFDCDGEYAIDGCKITCPQAHGEVTLREALTVSCNTTFAKLGRYFTADEFEDYARRFRLTALAQLPMFSKRGSIGDFGGEQRDVLLAETAFGQGETVLTPFAIARMTLAIANEGAVLEPYIIEAVRSPGGRILRSAREREAGRAVSVETARTLAGMMVDVVEHGTGRVASIRGVRVAGKTGSAENPHGRPHSWFTAFAPAESPEVVVTAVVENAGAGAEAAGPIVREVMAHLLSRAGVR